ncbi:MAG: SMC-Scp complex subunit ScpB, partial [Chloroflexota bacterium]|nr:SMC-Scp complex subunit ScpB [Chloroflexota bacterium]
MSNQNQPIQESQLSLSAQIESILFIAPEPISLWQLSKTLGVTQRQIEKGLDEIELLYQSRGICLQHHDRKVMITTVPEAAAIIEQFLGLE